MTVVTSANQYLERPRSSGLAEVVDIILDKGLVIDAFVRVSLLGLELLTIDARIVVASVDTYLRWAETVDRVVLAPAPTTGVPELLSGGMESGSRSKVRGAVEGVQEKAEGAKDKLKEKAGGGKKSKDGDEE